MGEAIALAPRCEGMEAVMEENVVAFARAVAHEVVAVGRHVMHAVALRIKRSWARG